MLLAERNNHSFIYMACLGDCAVPTGLVDPDFCKTRSKTQCTGSVMGEVVAHHCPVLCHTCWEWGKNWVPTTTPATVPTAVDSAPMSCGCSEMHSNTLFVGRTVQKIPPAMRLPPWYVEDKSATEWSWRECSVLCSENPQTCDLWMLQEMDGERCCVLKRGTSGETRAHEGVVGGLRQSTCTRAAARVCAADARAPVTTVAFCGRDSSEPHVGALVANGTRAGCDAFADLLTKFLVACGQTSFKKDANALVCAPTAQENVPDDAHDSVPREFLVGAATKIACVKAGKTLAPALTRFSGDTLQNIHFSCGEVAGRSGFYALALKNKRLLRSFCASGQRLNPMLEADADGTFRCQA